MRMLHWVIASAQVVAAAPVMAHISEARVDPTAYVAVRFPTGMSAEVGVAQIETTVPGTCSCSSLSRKDFRKCVAREIRKLDMSARTSAEIKALKKAVRKASCGLPAPPKKKPLACCMPLNDIAHIVTDALCAPVKKDAQCAALGGTLRQIGCVPNPCGGSPSDAFLDRR